MPRVLCVGLATVDLVYRVDRVPGVDEKAQATSVEIAAGGPAANAAVTAAVLGAETTLVTVVGAHPLGGLIRDDLQRYGVRLVDAAAGSREPPPLSSITVLAATGERTIVSRNAGAVTPEVPPELEHPAADVVLVDGHYPELARAAATSSRAAATDAGASACGGRGGPLLLVDAGHWRPVFADLLPLADVVACSAAFAAPDGLLDSVPHLAITHGPGPIDWRSGTESGQVVVPPVDAVDTAGAGDVFHGALAVALAAEPPVSTLPRVLAYAAGVAGVRVAHAGPRTWLDALRASPYGRSPTPS